MISSKCAQFLSIFCVGLAACDGAANADVLLDSGVLTDLSAYDLSAFDGALPDLSITTLDAGVIDSSTGDAPFADASSSMDGASFADASSTSTEDAARDGTTADVGTQLVPVYYVHDDPGYGLRLYREFRNVPADVSAVEGAVNAMLHLPARDPDYSSPWPTATRLLGVSILGTTATVNLSSDALSPSLGSEAEGMALQQLVHTVTAANNAITGVKLFIDGSSVETLWGHADASGTMTREPQINVLGRIWIIDPQHDDSVSRTLTFSGDGSAFEGSIVWSIEEECPSTGCSGTPYSMSGYSTASVGAPSRGTWSASVTIPMGALHGTGRVTISAWESSAKDGSAIHLDDKVIKID